MNQELFTKLVDTEKHLKHTKYQKDIDKAWVFFKQEDYIKVMNIFRRLPTQEGLMKKLIQSLKGKPVYKTLFQLTKKEKDNSITRLKAWFSLGTHAVIEIEQGRTEYKLLLPLVFQNIECLTADVLDLQRRDEDVVIDSNRIN
jgi:hypothetical protein